MNTIVIETSDALEFDKVSKLLSSADYDREHSLLKRVDIEHLWD